MVVGGLKKAVSKKYLKNQIIFVNKEDMKPAIWNPKRVIKNNNFVTVGSTTGTLSVQWASEVAGSRASLMQGSFLLIQEL